MFRSCFVAIKLLTLLVFSLSSVIETTNKRFSSDFYTGHLLANETTNTSLFYQLIPATNTTLADPNPLILWLEGGPGCSSQFGNWIEFGPYYISNISGKLVPTPRNVTWSQRYHLLFIDNPSNAGFSFPGSINVTDTKTSQIQVYNALVQFFDKYPELQDNPFFIFGESYGGHYIPVLGYEILTRGAKNFNFSGVGIGNAFTDPSTQIAGYSDYCFSAGVIDMKVRDQMAQLEIFGQKLIENGKYVEANDIFNQIEANLSKFVFINDFRVSTPPPIGYAYDLTQAYLNTKEAKTLYNISEDFNFLLCNKDAYKEWSYDMTTSVKEQLAYILSGTRVLLYNGADDIECNSAAMLKFISKLNWEGIGGFNKANRQIWNSNKGVLGNVKSSTNLTFVTVYNAGHNVPFYQPLSTLDMLTRFIDSNNDWSQAYLL